MSRSIRLALGAAALAALTFTLRPLVVTAAPEPARPADPQWKQLSAVDPPDTPIPPPPKPLSKQQLTESLARAAQRVNAPPIASASQTQVMRVTPMKPRLENGTRIVNANLIDFFTATGDVPDGVFLMNAPNGHLVSSIHMRVQTDKDRLHVADCRVRGLDTYDDDAAKRRLRVIAPGLNEDVDIVDDHLVFAFRGDAVGSSVKLYYFDAAIHYAGKMAFYGCDFVKAG